MATNGTGARLVAFGPPPLLEGEDVAAYDELLTQISSAVKPTGILEDIWVRNMVDLIWEILRYRRLKVNLLNTSVYRGLVRVLSPLLKFAADDKDQLSAEQLAKGWEGRHPGAMEQVEQLLASANLTMDAVMAHTLLEHLDPIERIDRMIAMAESRYNAMVREIDRHREALANALRRVAPDVEAGKYDGVHQKLIGRVTSTTT